MDTTSNYNSVSTPTDTSRLLNESNYAIILDAFNIQYKSSGYYWQIGEIPSTPSWVLDLSVISSQLPELLILVIPILRGEKISFQVVRDKAMTEYSLNGHLGAKYLAKLMVIYPPSPEYALSLAKELIALTKSFKGPAIRTDRHLGSIVYAYWSAYTTIPFNPPPKIIWPFSEITTAKDPPKPKLLNYAYYPTRIIKGDAKGDVMKALYFHKLWSIKPCIIKQGRQFMFMDQAGRDIRERLQWQYKLYSELSDDLPFPKIFDHFEISGDAYLAMQYINGRSLTAYLYELYEIHTWQDLSPTKRMEMIDHLLNIFEIIQKLHDKGYVHRDITTENFLLDKRNNIWLIDAELMWSAKTAQPLPPFGQGTPGFISPEQRRNSTPTTKEDIYAVGALMIAIFANLMPIKFQQRPGEILERNIFFFLNNQSMANIISDCLNADPHKRPSLSTITSTVKSFRQETNRPLEQKTPINIIAGQKLRNIIQSALNGLIVPTALDPNNRWVSKMQVDSKAVGNEQLGVTVQEGWYRGVSGPLWLIGQAHELGFDISQCKSAYYQNWDHIQKKYFSTENSNKSLYEGGSGIAMALTAGLNGDLLSPRSYSQYFDQCFSKTGTFRTLAEGMAGQGIGVHYASRWLGRPKVDELLSSYIQHLLATQLPDGSWPAPDLGGRTDYNIYTLNHGIAGIIWFLLACLRTQPNPSVKSSAIKALGWLITKANQKKKTWKWSDSPLSTEKGDLGIILVLLKAYKVLEMDLYKELAETFLNSIPERPVIMNYTLGNGLAGIGELYLEAFQVLKDKSWHKRATWIVQLLLHTLYIESDNYACWIPDSQSDFTADLFMGNSGIIHFLMRYLYPARLSHPLDPVR